MFVINLDILQNIKSNESNSMSLSGLDRLYFYVFGIFETEVSVIQKVNLKRINSCSDSFAITHHLKPYCTKFYIFAETVSYFQ